MIEENDRLRRTAKIAVLVAVVMFIVGGAVVWGMMGRCG